MQVSKFSDYALRLLLHLAQADGAKRTTREIAAQQRISFNHLAKVSQWLAAEAYITTSRGRGGGMVLAMDPAEISLGALLRKSEEGSALLECMRPDGGNCPLTAACGLSPILAEAQEAFFRHLDKVSLQDAIERRRGVGALIEGLESEHRLRQ
ncbi:Rrf2 family transcriptional regulator [Pikeienuella sp. HZG-20]|uniref:RrF2 family transcriptional regulator n=1 Tax=Paludibacillus litoralis TaxID=3133267 RepID=UPI0030EB2606